MNPALVATLVFVCGVLLVAERIGMRVTLQLTWRGDIKRETAFLAQYGQALCTPIIFILVWQLDRHGFRAAAALAVAVGGVTLLGLALKRLFGRVRPNREHAGRFLGPNMIHISDRESFPSNHTAAAVALSLVLARYYPAAAVTFWGLAAATSLLRYVQDAHWPSDIVAGVLLGYSFAHFTLRLFGLP